jgi:uncharacterized surface protein with fasciclin (FAS1) repeats
MEVKVIKRKIIVASILALIAVALFSVPVYASNTIVDIAVGDPNFSTLVAAVTAADLVGALSGPGPFTVFAPTDAAFAALPAGVLDLLLADTSALTQVLLYHVVLGKAMSTDLSDGDTLTTLEGGTLDVSIDGTVMINDATVTAADVEADNGVIHVIDKVLIPDALYTVVLVDVTYDEPANTSTWCYDVTCLTGDPDISHVDFEFKTCDPPLSDIIPSEDYEIVDPDPTTGVTGIKFDEPVNEGETKTFCFTLRGLWAVNDIEVYIKAATSDHPTHLPEGPACFFIPEVTLGSIMAVAAMFAAFGLYAYKKKQTPKQ